LVLVLVFGLGTLFPVVGVLLFVVAAVAVGVGVKRQLISVSW